MSRHEILQLWSAALFRRFLCFSFSFLWREATPEYLSHAASRLAHAPRHRFEDLTPQAPVR
jgi:hypothetical protein